jgi:hypothetical protein
LNKEIEDRKQGLDDSMLVVDTQQKTVKIWGEIEKAYLGLQQDLVNIHKEILGSSTQSQA